MKIAGILFLYLSVANAAPQGILSDIASALGFTHASSTSTTAGKSLLPPATVASTPTPTAHNTPSDSPTPTVTSRSSRTASSSNTQSTVTSSSSQDDSTTSTITSVSSSSSSSSTSTSSSSSSSSTSPPPTTTTQAITQPTQSPSPSQGNSVSSGGIIAAVIMILAILVAAGWLLFRYHPGVRRWWLAREDKRMQERSYRDAIDGPFARSGGSGVRDQALGQSRKSMLASFFAPRTVVLGNGQEIRRKPVNWGARPDVPPVPPMEKVALADMAAPMARTESVKSDGTYHSGSGGGIGSPGIGLGVTGLNHSNRSSPGLVQKELPPMPPMPPMPVIAELGGAEVKRDRDKDKRKEGGVHNNVLGRKSIYELA